MSRKHLRAVPHNLTPDVWWYEEPRGMCLIIQVRDEKQHVVPYPAVTIPWRSVRGALKRLDKK